MKTWMKPQIMVEQFRANEYIAACELTPVPTGATVYWDLWEDDGSFSMQIYHDGDSPSHAYDEPNTERFNFGSRMSYNHTYYGFDIGRWYTQKGLWQWIGSGQQARYNDYNDTTHWSKLGVYDIYIDNRGYAHMYQAGTATGTAEAPRS